MNECEHVILLDVCCTIKRPTTMCLAKKKKELVGWVVGGMTEEAEANDRVIRYVPGR